MNKNILKPEIQKFIKDHEDHDPFSLLLKHTEIAGVPVKKIVAQIRSRQKAKRKLPFWHSMDGIYYPPPLSLEQCSSEEASIYKSSHFAGKKIIDLTGGMGVDLYYFSRNFEEAVYLEKDEELARIAEHNFNILKAKNITVLVGDAETMLDSMTDADLIYIDPSRRAGKKVFMIRDSQPDVRALFPRIFNKSHNILIKLSPLMDISAAVEELPHVCQVLVLGIGNEVKEILIHIKKAFEDEPTIKAVDIHQSRQVVFEFSKSDELAAKPVFDYPQQYLYEPYATVLKSGAFKILSERFKVAKLHIHSHVYTSRELVVGFPGKTFLIEDVFRYDPKIIARAIADNMANLVTRNFPLNVENIKKQTGLREGGETFLFFTTDKDNRKIAIKAKKEP